MDVRLPKSTEADDQVDTVVQPDVLIVSDSRKLDARGMLTAIPGVTIDWEQVLAKL